jgi:hypothetical protein
MDYFSKNQLKKIFSQSPINARYIGSRESTWLEFKKNFSFGGLEDYAKSMAGFANHSGGYLVFGIKNNPREILGIKKTQFENLDTAKFTAGLNSIFSPEINWDSSTHLWKGKVFGLIYTHEHTHKPVIATKNAGQIKEADIYYRYNSRTERIKFGELSKIVSERLEQEKKSWMKIFKDVSLIGPQNAAILDTLRGKIEGLGKTVLIDEKLLPKLKFIKKGEFSTKKGALTLKLVGELKTVPVTALRERKVIVSEDIYRYRATDVCKHVKKKIRRRFRVYPEHVKAWKRHDVRTSSKPPQLARHFKNEYCEYKEAEKDYRFSQAWIDLLIKTYSSKKKYQKLKRAPS